MSDQPLSLKDLMERLADEFPSNADADNMTTALVAACKLWNINLPLFVQALGLPDDPADPLHLMAKNVFITGAVVMAKTHFMGGFEQIKQEVNVFKDLNEKGLL